MKSTKHLSFLSCMNNMYLRVTKWMMMESKLFKKLEIITKEQHHFATCKETMDGAMLLNDSEAIRWKADKEFHNDWVTLMIPEPTIWTSHHRKKKVNYYIAPEIMKHEVLTTVKYSCQKFEAKSNYTSRYNH